MSEIDIRVNQVSDPRYIRFEDQSELQYRATRLRKYESGDMVMIEEDDGAEGHVTIRDKEHATNLIAALNKAIDLGWLE